MRSLLIAAAALCMSAASAGRESKPFRIGTRTLVLLQDASLQDSHSRFISSFEARGHTVTVKSSGVKVALVKYGEQQYDNIVVLANAASALTSVDASDLVEFADNGGNLLVAAGPGLPSTLRKAAAEFGVDYDDPSSRVIDHFSYDAGTHTRVLSTAFFPSRHVVGDLASTARPVVYEGLGMSVSPDNILALRILTGSDTAYSADPAKRVEKYPASAGRDTLLAAGVQARNNARAVFLGSVWALSDEAFGVSSGGAQVGNAPFAVAISRWVCQESGVLRASGLRHSKADGTEPEWQVSNDFPGDPPPAAFPRPEIGRTSRVYRIKDDVKFGVDVHAYNGSAWAPFTANDMQLEFVMLDPYVRVPLASAPNGSFTAAFQVPDTYGIYHFRIMYRRPGLTTLYLRDQVNVRPFRHNEYERYILSAYPYYASAFAMMAGVFVFSFLFLYVK